MNRFLTLVIIAFFSCSAQAQEGIVFKIAIKPNTTYVSEMNGHTFYETVFTSGETLPSSMNDKQLIETTVKMKPYLVAEHPKENGDIPLSIRYEDAESTSLINGKKEQSMPLPISDIVIKAFYTTDNQIVLDTIVGASFNDRFNGMISEMLGQNVDFPEYPMQVGDEFTTEKPMSISSPAMKPLETNIKTTYLLNEIKAGKAYFTFQQDMNLESTQESFTLEAKGSGKGSCEYDIDGQYLSYFKSELPLHVTMNMNENRSSMVNLTTISEVKMSAE